jgi:hypothetical protein
VRLTCVRERSGRRRTMLGRTSELKNRHGIVTEV